MSTINTTSSPVPHPVPVEAIAQSVVEHNLSIKLVQGSVEPQPVGVQLDAGAVQHAVDEMRKHLEYANRKLEYSVHEASNQIVVRVEDRVTGQIIREVPDMEFLDLVSKLQEMVGFIINKNI